jgi:hypothetical protein
MVLWISGEIMFDVEETSRLASNEIESYVNDNIKSINYGNELEKWAYIAIMRPTGDKYYPEFTKYHKRRKVAEFRLKIDYERFKAAGPMEHRQLICQSLLRSIKMFPDIGVKDFDYKRLEEDFSRSAKEKGWL